MSTKTIKDKALLVGVIFDHQDDTIIREHLDELSLLADTAGFEVVETVTQRITKINPKYFVGQGKAQEIANLAKILEIKWIIFDDDLSPTQIKVLSKLVKDVQVIDRSGLILDIFRRHAKTREAKTQVELAQLEYTLPRLTRQWVHLERQMGGLGTRAGMGETQIEIDRRAIRKRIAKLKTDLQRIEKERAAQSKGRQEFFRAALVGYTNAGKSTLMKAITGADVYIEDQLFATLDTTIRQVKFDDQHRMLLSDTVGFIRKLPHDLVASFKSTLKEVVDSDLLLIVLDASSPYIMDHFETINLVLKELAAIDKKKLIVLNKADLVEDPVRLMNIKKQFPDAVMISALKHFKINELLNQLKIILDTNDVILTVEVPYNDGKTLAELERNTKILNREYVNTGIILKIQGSRHVISKTIHKHRPDS